MTQVGSVDRTIPLSIGLQSRASCERNSGWYWKWHPCRSLRWLNTVADRISASSRCELGDASGPSRLSRAAGWLPVCRLASRSAIWSMPYSARIRPLWRRQSPCWGSIKKPKRSVGMMRAIDLPCGLQKHGHVD